MKKSKLNLIIISFALLCAMAVNLIGCTTNISAQNLMIDITPNNITALNNLTDDSAQITDFAIRLFKQTNENDKNTLISPLSVLYALAMTANGANDKTREQMEAVLGMSVDELNLYLYSYLSSLAQGEQYKLKLANSIWFKDNKSFTVNQKFLQTNADYYKADIYKAPFNTQTVNDINNWVKNETNKMITDILSDIPEEAIMYLINTLAFEAEWAEGYMERKVYDKIFTKEDGTKQDVKLMYSTEDKYIEDKNAVGFIKYYTHQKYAFVALLPNKNITVAEYINSLNGNSLSTMLANAETKTVMAAIPKFETKYETEMSETLKSMGMTNAFDANLANFKGIGTSNNGNIYINKVIHKTYIQVSEIGTKAGAATVVQMNGYGSEEPIQTKQVYLDRPFVYMLIDCENNIPFFIGTVIDVK